MRERAIEIELEQCPNNGGDLKIIVAILESVAIEKILTHLGLQAAEQLDAASSAFASAERALDDAGERQMLPERAWVACGRAELALRQRRDDEASRLAERAIAYWAQLAPGSRWEARSGLVARLGAEPLGPGRERTRVGDERRDDAGLVAAGA